MLFSRFSRSSSQPSGVDSVAVEGEEKSQSAYGLSTMSQSTSTITETAGAHTQIKLFIIILVSLNVFVPTHSYPVYMLLIKTFIRITSA